MAASQVMRITLKAYDHQLIDASAKSIIETVKKTGSKVSGPVPVSYTHLDVYKRQVLSCLIPMLMGSVIVWRQQSVRNFE